MQLFFSFLNIHGIDLLSFLKCDIEYINNLTEFEMFYAASYVLMDVKIYYVVYSELRCFCCSNMHTYTYSFMHTKYMHIYIQRAALFHFFHKSFSVWLSEDDINKTNIGHQQQSMLQCSEAVMHGDKTILHVLYNMERYHFHRYNRKSTFLLSVLPLALHHYGSNHQ